MTEPKLRFTPSAGNVYPDLCSSTMGDHFTERNEPGNPSLPFLTVSIHSGISNGELDEDALGKRVKRSADPATYKKVETGDLVFNMMRAWQGAVGCAKAPGMVSPAYIVAIPDESVYPPHMDLYVQSDAIVDQFNKLSYGALDFRKRLYWDSFVTTEISLPSVEEQKQIADYFAVIEELISCTKEEISNLETQKKAVVKKVFSQEVRFKKNDGTDFPDWEEKKLGEIADIIGGGTPDTAVENYWANGDIEWFTPTEVGHEKYVGNSKRKISKLGFAKSSARKLPAGTLLLTSRATIGEMSIAKKECCTNQGFQSLIVHDGVDNEFIYYCQPIIKRYGLKHAAGSTFLEVSGTNMGKCPLMIPCLEEQRLIVDFLTNFDEAIAAAKKELELWKELKKGLLQQMFV